MAEPIRRILVAIRDLGRAPGAQLSKAASLARPTGAAIELFHAIDTPLSSSSLERVFEDVAIRELRQNVVDHTLRRLARLARSPSLRGLRVSWHAGWDSPAHEAIVRRALHSRADLVIAANQARRPAGRWLLQNTDWELIRQCPCPLLLVKLRRGHRKPAVIVAVDPFHTHAKPANLDRRLLDYGTRIARLLGGSVHAFHCYMPLPNVVPLPVGAAMPMVLPPEVETAHRELVARSFDRLAKSAGVAPLSRHLCIGLVRNELETLVTELNASLVVMGVVSRSALRRTFIGSTAERVLDHLPCDVLVVKPRGFKTDVPRRRPLPLPGALSLA